MKRFIFILVILFSSYANTESLRLVTENLPPLQIIQPDGVPSGVMVDIVNLLLKQTSLDGQVEILPWARSYQIALAEKNTLIFSMFRGESREKKFQWIGNLLTVNSYLVALKTTKSISVNSINEAKSYTVGSIRQDLAEHYLKEHGFKEDKNLYLSSDYKVLWQMLFNGRTDLAFTNDVMWQHEIKDVGLDSSQIKMIYKIPNFASDLYLAASLTTDKDIVKRLSKALAQIKADGQYQAILDKWHISLNSPFN